MGRRGQRAVTVISGGVLLLAVAGGAFAVDRDLDTPRDLHRVEFASSGECARCHPDHHESWASTFHRRMTQTATEESVLGSFDGATFVYGGIEATMSRGSGGEFQMRFEGPDGLLSSAEIVRTVGSRRVQQYLARQDDVYFRLPMAWHIEEGRWFHMNGAFLTADPEAPEPGERISREDYDRHVTRWNDNCVFCHNVGANPGLEAERFSTEVAELGVACEACHGPGDEHVRANRNPMRRYALHLSERPDPTIVNPARLSPRRSAEVCGRCHGQRITDDIDRFMAEGDTYVPGEPLSEYSRPLARDTPLNGDREAFAVRFWSDGTPRLTAYEYQGLLQSPCTDLTCTDCHGMHEGDPRGQLRPSAVGDGACNSCHAEIRASRNEAHRDHPSVACVDCHMPRIVYGLIGVHRSHRIEIPEAGVTGRPDTCALCHASDERGRVVTDALSGDPIERAVAVAALGRRDIELSEERLAYRRGIVFNVMLEDPYPAVRRIARRSLEALGPLQEPLRFEATASRAERDEVIRAFRRELPAIPPPPAWARELRRRADTNAIAIGE